MLEHAIAVGLFEKSSNEKIAYLKKLYPSTPESRALAKKNDAAHENLMKSLKSSRPSSIPRSTSMNIWKQKRIARVKTGPRKSIKMRK